MVVSRKVKDPTKLGKVEHRGKPRGREITDMDVVRLTQDFDGPAGRIAKGTQGTVLQVFDSGQAYQVEFEGDFEVPETVPGLILEFDVRPTQR